MATITPRLEDFDYNTPVKDGEYNANMVKVLVEEAEKSMDIPHGLNRIPQKVDIVYSDCTILFETSEKTTDRVICTFFENNVTILMRFE